MDEWIFLTAETTTGKREGRIEVEKHTHTCRKHKNLGTKSWYIPAIAMWRTQIWCRKKRAEKVVGPNHEHLETTLQGLGLWTEGMSEGTGNSAYV